MGRGSGRLAGLSVARSALRLRGVTLVELMLALSVLSLVGICIVMMIKGAADGTSGQTDGRRHLVRMQAIEAQVAETVRPCNAILAAGNGYMVLWRGDGKNRNIATNQAVNLSELALLEYDSSSKQLKLYQTVFPAGMSAAAMIAADSTYAASSNWYNAATAAKNSAYFTPTVLANSVSEFTVSLDSGTATSAKIATLKVTLNDGVVSRSMVISASLRQLMAPS